MAKNIIIDRWMQNNGKSAQRKKRKQEIKENEGRKRQTLTKGGKEKDAIKMTYNLCDEPIELKRR